MVDALAQPREVAKDLLEPRGHLGLARADAEHAELQIFEHGQVRQHAPLLGDPGDAAPHDLVRGQPGEVLAAQAHAAARGARQAHDGSQRGRLAGAVAADEADHLALADGERHALQDVGLAVIRVDVLELEQAHERTTPR